LTNVIKYFWKKQIFLKKKFFDGTKTKNPRIFFIFAPNKYNKKYITHHEKNNAYSCRDDNLHCDINGADPV
jgi:hypothetical protein